MNIYFFKQTYLVDTYLKHHDEPLLMSTHNIDFLLKIRKISILFSENKSIISTVTITFLPLWANSVDNKFKISYFCQKICFHISCKLSP